MKKNIYNLTNPQKNIWQLEQISLPEDHINNILAIMKLEKNLDLKILDKTINKIIEINDSLRIKIIKKGNEIFQTIENYSYKPTRIIYLDTDDIQTFAENFKNKDININTNLFEFSLIATPNNTFVFYKSHHIISDAWGMTQVGEQIKELYSMISNGEDISNYKKPTYTDFINREQKYLNSNKYLKDREFWTEYVQDMEPVKLFNDSRSASKKSNRYSKVIPNSLFSQITNFCRNNLITEYTFFMTILSIYFYKMLNCNSLVVGTPFLNRTKKNNDFENTGIFISTLPINIPMSDNISFVDLCKELYSNNLKIFRHACFPYSEIQSLYNTAHQITTNLYDIGFSYQINKMNTELNHDKGNSEWYSSGSQNNAFTFHISSLNNDKLALYDYQTAHFTLNDIKNMDNRIFNIISQILNSSNILIKDITVLTENDIKTIKAFNNTGTIEIPQLTTIDMFNSTVNSHPDNRAIICGKNSITYSDLSKRIDELANYLISIGLKGNMPIALFFDKSFDMIISMFAVLKAGGCYVPILPDENINRIRYILNDCKPFCILTNNSYLEKLHSLNLDCIDINQINVNTTKLNNISIDINDTAYIIYTSGSTGNPKGTQVSHENIVSLMHSTMNDPLLKPTSEDISMSLLKYSFDASGIDIYSSLLFGGTLLLIEKQDELNPEKVLHIMENQKVTRSFLIPKWLEHIAIEDSNLNTNLSSLKFLGSGGEVLKPHLLKSLHEKYPNLKILNLYGPTEATMFTTYKIVTENEFKNNSSSIGKPIPFSRAFVVNSNNNVLPLGTKGELIIYEDDTSIHNISKGYLNLPEQTSQRFITILNPISKKYVSAYKTGDIVRINENMEIEFIERTDDIVKINGGYLVALNEVEKKISSLLGPEFKVCPIAVPFKNTKVIILFICKSDNNISFNNLKQYINNNISFYMKPKTIIELNDFPRNSSGKIDKKKLKELALQHLNNRKDHIVLPKTKTEKKLFKLIKKLEGIDDLSITDDFFEGLGIDSLSLTNLYSHLDNYPITIQDLYNNSSIKDLAYFIDSNQKNKINLELSDVKQVQILNNCKPFDLSHILLTGVTGFLGIHLLYDLLINPNVKKIYCIIRNKIQLPGYKRLLNRISYYYDSDPNILNLVNEKVEVINGDSTKYHLGINEKIYTHLKSTITTVINSAANVRHYAKYNELYKDNVISVNNIIDFCDNSISLAHISTLSIGGFKNSYSCNFSLDEDTLFINQDFKNNPYLISKFIAEKNILLAIQNSNLNAKIFRMGNIMCRQSDGKFQKNYNQNVFIAALKMIIDIGIIPKDYLNLELEFSPVDECSKSIIKLIELNNSNTIYHCLNNNTLKISDLKNILEKLGYTFSIEDINSFKHSLDTLNDQYTKEYILNNNLNSYSLDKTLFELSKANMSWSRSDIIYIQKILDIINNNKW